MSVWCTCRVWWNLRNTELNKVLDYIPSKEYWHVIGQFARECELKSQGVADAFDDISSKFSVVSGFDADYAEFIESKLKS